MISSFSRTTVDPQVQRQYSTTPSATRWVDISVHRGAGSVPRQP
ncbi:hypothetical protein [Streptomyces venezuelae]